MTILRMMKRGGEELHRSARLPAPHGPVLHLLLDCEEYLSTKRCVQTYMETRRSKIIIFFLSHFEIFSRGICWYRSRIILHQSNNNNNNNSTMTKMTLLQSCGGAVQDWFWKDEHECILLRNRLLRGGAMTRMCLLYYLNN